MESATSNEFVELLKSLTQVQKDNLLSRLRAMAILPSHPLLVVSRAVEHLQEDIEKSLEGGGQSVGLGVISFKDGELLARLESSVRGTNVFCVQSFCSFGDELETGLHYTPNDALIELFITLDAIRRSSPHRVTVVIPYFGYGNQDCYAAARQSLAAPLIATCLERYTSHIIVVEPPSLQIAGFFSVPVEIVGMERLFAPWLQKRFEKELAEGRITVVAARPASSSRARRLARRLGTDAPIAVADNLAHIDLTKTHGMSLATPSRDVAEYEGYVVSEETTRFFRPFGHSPLFSQELSRPDSDDMTTYSIVGNVADQLCIVTDDALLDTHRMESVAQACLSNGASKVFVVVAHCAVPPHSLRALGRSIADHQSPIDGVAILPTVSSLSHEYPGISILQKELADALGDAIQHVHEEIATSSKTLA